MGVSTFVDRCCLFSDENMWLATMKEPASTPARLTEATHVS